MNTFFNTCTNIMQLQLGNAKCVKMHIGKQHKGDICPKLKVDSWKDVVITRENGKTELKDKYNGKEDMMEVNEKEIFR